VFSPAQCLRILAKPGQTRSKADISLLAGTLSKFHVFSTIPQEVMFKLCRFLRHVRYKRGVIGTFQWRFALPLLWAFLLTSGNVRRCSEETG